MKAVILATFVTVICAQPPKKELTHLEHIDYINRQNSTWQAGVNFHPETPTSVLKRLAGTNTRSKRSLPERVIDVSKFDYIPKEFDARLTWPDCPTIGEILSQGNCGSCWAFATAAAISDRHCIHNGITVRISAQELVTCCKGNHEDYDWLSDSTTRNGCEGGWPDKAWQYWVQNGLVTGGKYQDKSTCQPYSFKPCDGLEDHYGKYQHCKHEFEHAPACKSHCRKGYPLSFQKDKHYGRDYYVLSTNEVSQIQAEIMTNGPVVAVYHVWTDFYHYKSGVYQRLSGWPGNLHAVKLLGWGEDELGTPYWLAANSWTDEWGDKGFFKILRGSDECGIESRQVTAGRP